MGSAKCGDAHGGGKGEEGSYTDRYKRVQEHRRKTEGVFYEVLQTLLFGHLCLAAL